MHYHSLYFSAMAYTVLATNAYKEANEKSSGMGIAVSFFKKATAELDKAKAVVTLVPSNYQDNFNNKYAEVCKLRDKAINENKTIYFDREVPIEKIPKPDMQNFVKLEPALDNI